MDVDEERISGAETEEAISSDNRLKPKFADVALGDILKLQNEVGIKQFPKVVMMPVEDEAEESTCDQQLLKRDFKSNIVGKKKLRDVIKGPKEEPIYREPTKIKMAKVKKDKNPVRRDPRFDDLSGNFNQEFFDKEYSFLRDIKQKELSEIKAKHRKSRDPEEKAKLHRLMQRYKEEEKMANKRDVEREVMNKYVEEEASKVERGKKPFYLKKQQLKEMVKSEQIKRGLLKAGKKQEINRSKNETQKSRKNFPERR